MNPSRADLLIQYALAAAAQEDAGRRELGPIHLIKYVYLGDLAYAEEHAGETFTGAPWKFHHFGPWAVEVFQRIEPAVSAVHASERVFNSRHGEDAKRWSLRDGGRLEELEKKIPWPAARAIRRAVHEHGSDTKNLLHHVYRTVPMLKASPGELLSFRAPQPEAAGGPPSAPAEAPPHLSKTTAKKLKARIAERLAQKREAREKTAPMPAPRYDEVFFAGREWLDSLTELEPIEGVQGELQFSEEIWKSDARGTGELP
ncbi:MAG TPA: hypothetical protein VHN15_09205 [Thermoanaerobaculia bacterium]|nr:hypothetical protein [Thermoanaerobaculia bacterium]